MGAPMSLNLFPGCLASIDESALQRQQQKCVTVWSNVKLNIENSFQEKNFTQIDVVNSNEVVMVLEVNRTGGGVIVLTPRGRTGIAMIGHLRAL